MQTIYKIQIEYPSEKDKFDLEPGLDKEINTLLEKLKALNIRSSLQKDVYDTGE